MSSIKIKTKDYTALPTALLPMAKAHARVDGNYDDATITSMIARAIDWFERTSRVTVFETSYEWKPDQADFTDDIAPIPFSPVGTMTVSNGATPPTDLSASFTATTMSQHGVGIYQLNGAFVAGMIVTIASGYAAGALPPGLLDVIMRYTAHLYDNREILVPGQQIATPEWTAEVIGTYWVPHV